MIPTCFSSTPHHHHARPAPKKLLDFFFFNFLSLSKKYIKRKGKKTCLWQGMGQSHRMPQFRWGRIIAVYTNTPNQKETFPHSLCSFSLGVSDII